MKVMNVA